MGNAAAAGLGALGGIFGGGGGEGPQNSYWGEDPREIEGKKISIDPRDLMAYGMNANLGLGRALSQRAEADLNKIMGPQAIVQTPNFYSGGGMPMAIGTNVRDVGWHQRMGKHQFGKGGLNDPFPIGMPSGNTDGDPGDDDPKGPRPPIQPDASYPEAQASSRPTDAAQMASALRALGVDAGGAGDQRMAAPAYPPQPRPAPLRLGLGPDIWDAYK